MGDEWRLDEWAQGCPRDGQRVAIVGINLLPEKCGQLEEGQGLDRQACTILPSPKN